MGGNYNQRIPTDTQQWKYQNIPSTLIKTQNITAITEGSPQKKWNTVAYVIRQFFILYLNMPWKNIPRGKLIDSLFGSNALLYYYNGID